MPNISPCLWFDTQAEKGSVMTAVFQLDGQEFIALNGGPVFKFTEAISLIVNCKTQEEVDTCWAKLLAGRRGRPVWLAQG